MRFKKSSLVGSGTAITILLKIYGLPGMVKNYQIWKGWLGCMDLTTLLTWLPLFLGVALSLYFFRQERRLAKDNFDMAMKTAIAAPILSKGYYASYTPRSRAEMEAFCEIHRLACEGKIRVSGKAHSWPAPRQLTLKQLRESTPYDMVVPVSPEDPQGRVLVLGPIDPDMSREQSSEGVYWGLRMDSRDIYKFWPNGGEE